MLRFVHLGWLSLSLAILSSCGTDGDPAETPKEPEVPEKPETPKTPGTLELRLGAQALTSYDFGSVTVSTDSPALALTVVNTGPGVTGVLTVRLEGRDAGAFDTGDVHTDCDGAVVLAPDATCSIRIRFRPSQSGSRSARLVVTAPPGAATPLELSGTGVAGPDPEPDPAPACANPPGTTVTGNYRIRTSADVAGLAGVGTITGDLVIDAPGMRTLSLPGLVVVGGDLLVQPTSQLLGNLQLPALCRVGRRAAFVNGSALGNLGVSALRIVEGSLEIAGTSIASLPLGRLESVGGDLRLERNPLITTAGTSASLRSIGGSLRLIDDVALASLSGLGGLSTLGGLEIHALPGLTNLDGITVPAQLGSLHLESNDGLESLAALTSLRAVREAMRIIANPKLVSFAGLDNLVTAGTLEIRDNLALADTSALGRVELFGSVTVTNNDALASLVLPALAAIDRELQISGNDALAELQLELLTALGQPSIISANPSLPVCRAERVRNRLRMSGYTGGFTIEDNGPCGIGPAWLKIAGGSATEQVNAIAAFSDGSFIVGATLSALSGTGTAIFGPGEPRQTELATGTAQTAVLARYRADGTLDWASTGGLGDRGVIDVVTYPDGSSAALIGRTIDLRSATGAPVRSHLMSSFTTAIAAAPDSGFIVAGRTPCGSFPCNNGFLTAFDATGWPVWSTIMLHSDAVSFGNPSGIARLSDGTLLVSGTVSGTVTFGFGTPNEISINVPSGTGYVARYSAAGVFRGVETLSDTSPRVVSGGDFAAVCGVTRAAPAVLSDGTGPARTVPASQLFVVRYGANGRIGWISTGRRVNGGIDPVACSVAAGSQGVAVSSIACDDVIFYEGALDETRTTPAGGCDSFTARFGTDGVFRGTSISDTTMSAPRTPATAMTSDGRALLFGTFANTIRVGPFNVPMPWGDQKGLFITRFDNL